MRRRTFLLALAAFATSMVSGPVRAETPPYPNLVPMAPSFLHIGLADALPDGSPPPYPYAVRFSTRIANRGLYALDVLAEPTQATDLGEQTATAHQCTAWVTRVCTERHEVGTFSWSTQHLHFHIDGLVSHELRRLLPPDADGIQEPDMSDEGLVATKGKVTFCLQDTGYDVTWDPTNPAGAPIYQYCPAALQGISAGAYDEYGYGLYGQSFSLNGIDDGVYAVVIRLNPAGAFYETRVDDNVSWTRFRISNHGGTLTVF
ncbi:MAG TPA: lysyl oxidase family protein [Actinomycetota bacterium]